MSIKASFASPFEVIPSVSVTDDAVGLAAGLAVGRTVDIVLELKVGCGEIVLKFVAGIGLTPTTRNGGGVALASVDMSPLSGGEVLSVTVSAASDDCILVVESDLFLPR